MAKQKLYLADDRWRWREIALTTCQPEDFKLALYHLKKQDSHRWMRFWLLFFVMSMGCGWGCTLATKNITGTGWGLMVMLAGFFANPFLLSNYFSPTELSVCQDVIRMRNDRFEADPVFSLAKTRVWSLRWQTLMLVLVETAFMSIFWLSMCLPYTTMIEFSQMKPMQLELALFCMSAPLFFYFIARSLGAGVYGAYGPFPSVERHLR